MTRMACDAQDLSDHLQLLASFTQHFESHTTTYVGQLSRQVHQRTFRPDIFRHTFSDYVRAGRIVPLGADFEARQIARSGAIVGFDSRHVHSSSARNFSSTDKSSRVVTSPATVPLVAISRSKRRMILPDRVLGSASVNLISSGRARAPISFTTCSRSSWFNASDGLCDPSNVTKATIDDPFNSAGRGTTAASATAL